jgi:hypothetical protein
MEPSTILYSAPPGGSSPPTIEPLYGTLTVVDAPYPYDFLPVQLVVAGVEFRSAQHFVKTTKYATTLTCAGERAFGCLAAADFDHVLFTSITLSIDGQDLRVGGEKDLEEEEVRRYPPLWGFELCGRIPGHCCGSCEDIRRGAIPGYILTIYATSDGPE